MNGKSTSARLAMDRQLVGRVREKASAVRQAVCKKRQSALLFDVLRI
jgi:hypothetical protein